MVISNPTLPEITDGYEIQLHHSMGHDPARRHGVAPNLLYRWRRLLSEGGAAAVDSDEPVVGNSEVKKLEDRVRELERMLGRKTMEVEILREALSKADSKKRISRPILLPKDGSR